MDEFVIGEKNPVLIGQHPVGWRRGLVPRRPIQDGISRHQAVCRQKRLVQEYDHHNGQGGKPEEAERLRTEPRAGGRGGFNASFIGRMVHKGRTTVVTS